MSRDIRKLFQKNERGKLSEQGNGGIFEQEDKKCETEAGEILCGAWENRLKRADKRAEKGVKRTRRGAGIKSLPFRQVERSFSL